MQLKVHIKNLADKKHISAQLVMQNYMTERLLERISLSEYRSNFIIKGGFLIAAVIGLDSRATLDLDTTIKGFALNVDSITTIFSEVCKIALDDNITFVINGVGEIREGDEYTGYRVLLGAVFFFCLLPFPLLKLSLENRNFHFAHRHSLSIFVSLQERP